MNRMTRLLLLLALSALIVGPVFADGISFTTGAPNGSMAIASRPGNGSQVEIEAADDFVFAVPASITSATFTGLVPSGASIDQVVVEIYRVFPKDSTVPPDGRVPTRMNSPSDVAFDSRISGSGLSFTTSTLSSSFTAKNSVLNGIFPKPNQNTLGEGPVTAPEVQFNVSFSTPFNLPADHFFFVPQVSLSNGDFFWLSAARPNVIDPFAPDLQAWVRNGPLDPDWLRVGTDIVGGSPAPTFNTSFSITAVQTPEPSSAVLLIVGLVACVFLGWKTNRAL
jgi:hypothetical protein